MNEAQILAWNPEDREFKALLEEAKNLEKYLIQDLHNKHKQVSVLSKDELKHRLHAAISKRKSDW